MLTIRKAQMAVLGALAHERFVADQCDQWLVDDPSLDPDQVAAWVEDGLARAHSYGLRTNRQFELFVDAMIVFGPEFDLSEELGWGRQILTAPVSATLKWEAFRSRVENELVREGRR
jgi:hypothetical protein